MKVITINNLAESTTEEVFEYIKHHLLTQMKKCVDDKGLCLYRNEQGLKCAAGCLIPDDMYNSNFEYEKWSALVRQQFAPADHKQLIQRMQYIHDDTPVSDWELVLNEVGSNLDVFDK
jgi:hypothetical protein